MKKQKLLSKVFLGVTTIFLTNIQLYSQTLVANKDAQLSGLSNNGINNNGYTDILTASVDGAHLDRGVLEFDINLCNYPDGIQSAHLELYTHGGPSAGGAHVGSSPDTDFKIELNNSSWQENTVNWNLQPGVHTSPVVNVQGPTSAYYDYTNSNAIDVTSLVDEIINTGNNFGFKISLQNETQSSTSKVEFSSSDDPFLSRHPKLIIVPVGTGTFPYIVSSPITSCYGMSPIQLLPSAPQGTYTVSSTGADGLVSSVSGGMETWTFDPSVATNMSHTITACISNGCCYDIEINTGNPWPKTTNSTFLYDGGRAIETDQLGGVYSAGVFVDNTQFNGIGVTGSSLTQDVNSYIAKYDNCNDLEWVVTINSNDHVTVTGMSISHTQQLVYVIGSFNHGVTLNSAVDLNGPVSPSTTSSYLGDGFFVAAYDYSGVLQYDMSQTASGYTNSNGVITATRTEYPANIFNDIVYIGINKQSGTEVELIELNFNLTGGIGGSLTSPVAIEIKDIASDAGRLYLTGNFQHHVRNFVNLPILATNSSVQDAFIIGLDVTVPGANPPFTYKEALVGLTGPSTTTAYAEGIDGVRNRFYFTGSYNGGTVTQPFGGTIPLSAPAAGFSNAYVGGILGNTTSWAEYIDGHQNSAIGVDVDVDRITEAPFFTGTWNGNEFHISGSPVTPAINNVNGSHVYVASFDVNGAPLWSNHSISSGVSIARIAHENGFLYTSGAYTGTMNMWNEVLSPNTPLNSPLVSTLNSYNSCVWRFAATGNFAGNAYRYKSSKNAIEEVESSKEVKLYPNPTSGVVQMEIDVFEVNKNYEMKVVNALGKVVKEMIIFNESTSIDLGDQPAGLYFVQLKEGENSTIYKVMKSK